MKSTKFLLLPVIFSVAIFFSGALSAKEFKLNAAEDSKSCVDNVCSGGGQDGDVKVDETYEEINYKSYRRIYVTFGFCGSYFARKGGNDLKGMMGAYTDIEYRLFKSFSFGFDSYYGWLSGSGNQYLSAFNPGLKIYPMLYKYPSFEPFFFFGGHVYDAVFGSTGTLHAGMGQGAFAGAGFKMLPESSPIGLEVFVRSSFVWMQRPDIVGGRGLAIPIFGFVGATY